MRIRIAASLAALILAPAAAVAQVDGQTAVEGYVFDVATKKPLANAIVTVKSSTPNTDGFSIAAQITNASGFFAIPTGIAPEAQTVVTAECTTSRGVASSELPLYTPVRPIVYRRDFYLSLPKRAKGCVLP
jgi:hypothetical protein